MPTYVAFLRAINLGRTRKFPKDAIRAAVEGVGCTDVETYINTGNVRLRSPLRSRAKVEALLESAFLADRGFEVPTVVFTPAELSAVAATVDTLAHPGAHPGAHYVELLREPPSDAAVEALAAVDDPTGTAVVDGRAVHLLVDADYSGATVLRAAVARQLGVSTNRNATVVRELARRWGA